MKIKYKPSGRVTAKFLKDDSFVRGLMGPIGSGKSVACAIEILRRARMQAPSKDGVRRTRWCVIRNSYPELKSTTIKTWSDWCPLEYGRTNFDSPIIHRITDQGIDMEVLFLALDRPEDVKKLLSLELTGAWVNEAREVPKAVIDALTGRVGRYPSQNMGGCTWSGIFMDTNPPDDQSWWFEMSEEETPEGWRFFKQPSGVSDMAENKRNLPQDYYERIQAGKNEDWVNVYVHGQYGYLMEGKVVYPEYKDSTHAANEVIQANPAFPLIIAADFGLTPVAVIGQKLPDGRWQVLDEYMSTNHGVRRFGELLKSYVAEVYPGFDVATCYGDPSGGYRGKESEETCFKILNDVTPWKWEEAPGDNDVALRLEVVKQALNRMIDGYPGIMVSPKCKVLRKGFVSGYHYKFVKGFDGTRTQEVPDKNMYSHPHDALQYLLLGGGETSVVFNRGKVSGRDRWKNNPRMLEQMRRIESRESYNPFKQKSYKPKGW
jgi:hypothetical protein